MSDEAKIEVLLLPVFGLGLNGRPRRIPRQAQRLVALLAITGRPTNRMQLCRLLWPDADAHQSRKRLRHVLWIAGTCLDEPLIEVAGDTVGLLGRTSVDLAEAVLASERLAESTVRTKTLTAVRAAWMQPLLTEHDDEWLRAEQARWDVTRSFALQRLARLHLDQGELHECLTTCADLKALDPLDETPYRLATSCHARRGAIAKVVVELEAYAGLLRAELRTKLPADLQRALDAARGGHLTGVGRMVA